MSSGDLATFIGDDRAFQLGRITVNFQHCGVDLRLPHLNLIPTDDEMGGAITAQLPFSKTADTLPKSCRPKTDESP